jgi:HPt (histidine-containing phosphotransfer) domain-containing protein
VTIKFAGNDMPGLFTANTNIPTNNGKIFDLDEALLIVDGDRELFQEIAQTYIESYRAELATIQKAIDLPDPAGLRAASHHFKGSLSALAAGPALEAVMRLEDMGRRADFGSAAAVYASLSQQAQALAAALGGVS